MRVTPIQTQLSDEDHARLAEAAEDKGLSVSALVRSVLVKFLNGDMRL